MLAVSCILQAEAHNSDVSTLPVPRLHTVSTYETDASCS